MSPRNKEGDKFIGLYLKYILIPIMMIILIYDNLLDKTMEKDKLTARQKAQQKRENRIYFMQGIKEELVWVPAPLCIVAMTLWAATAMAGDTSGAIIIHFFSYFVGAACVLLFEYILDIYIKYLEKQNLKEGPNDIEFPPKKDKC